MTTQVAVNAKTYIAMILDKSSSMFSIREEARTAYNEQLATIREQAKTQDVSVFLTQFSTVPEITTFNESVEVAQDLTEDDYVPCGMTALYDAIGLTIDRMQAELSDINEDHVSVLFVIISDGAENCSQEYRSPSSIQSKIKSLQDTNRWTFTFLGANVDIMTVADNLGLHKGNAQAFVASSAGMTQGREKMTRGLSTYLSSRETYSSQAASAVGATVESMSTQNFYSDANDEDSDNVEGSE